MVDCSADLVAVVVPLEPTLAALPTFVWPRAPRSHHEGRPARYGTKVPPPVGRRCDGTGEARLARTQPRVDVRHRWHAGIARGQRVPPPRGAPEPHPAGPGRAGLCSSS